MVRVRNVLLFSLFRPCLNKALIISSRKCTRSTIGLLNSVLDHYLFTVICIIPRCFLIAIYSQWADLFMLVDYVADFVKIPSAGISADNSGLKLGTKICSFLSFSLSIYIAYLPFMPLMLTSADVFIHVCSWLSFSTFIKVFHIVPLSLPNSDLWSFLFRLLYIYACSVCRLWTILSIWPSS